MSKNKLMSEKHEPALLVHLTPEWKETVMSLFCDAFENDHYYAKMFPTGDRKKAMSDAFGAAIEYCLKNGLCVGAVYKGELIGFLLSFDYYETMYAHKASFLDIFDCESEDNLPYADSLHKTIRAFDGLVVYLLSAAVKEEYRRRGVASAMLDCLMEKEPSAYFVGDVSNEKSLPMYEKRGFDVSKLDDGYFVVMKNTPL